jgi:hypothetical protein
MDDNKCYASRAGTATPLVRQSAFRSDFQQKTDIDEELNTPGLR